MCKNSHDDAPLSTRWFPSATWAWTNILQPGEKGKAASSASGVAWSFQKPKARLAFLPDFMLILFFFSRRQRSTFRKGTHSRQQRPLRPRRGKVNHVVLLLWDVAAMPLSLGGPASSRILQKHVGL